MAELRAMVEKTAFLSCDTRCPGANIPGKPRLYMPNGDGLPGYQGISVT